MSRTLHRLGRAAGLLILACGSAGAAVWYVAPDGNDAGPGTQAQPFLTIQRGLLKAQSGDTVRVGDGTYSGPGNIDLDFLGRNITLQSQGGAETCVIDARDEGRGFQFHSGESSAAVLDGFTIRNGYDRYVGGGIFILGSSPTVRNCVVTDCNVGEDDDAGGGGVCVGGTTGAGPRFERCVITGNAAFSSVSSCEGGGALITAGANVTFTNCTLSGNDVSTLVEAGAGAGLAVTGNSSCTMISSRVNNNNFELTQGASLGAGVYVEDGMLSAVDSTFSGNTTGGMEESGSTRGGGLYLHGSRAAASLTNCRVLNNAARGVNGMADGGGACLDTGASLVAVNSIFAGNRASSGVQSTGGAIATLDAGTNLKILNGVITNNTAEGLRSGKGFGGSVAMWKGATTNITNTLCVYNKATTSGDLATIDASYTITYSLFHYAVAGEGNVVGEPAFRDAAGSDYRLVPGSPGVDAGTASVLGLPPYDIDYHARVAGAAPDMGAYELYAPPYFSLDLYVDRATGNDDNPGTSSAPLATVTAALSRLDDLKYTTVFLKAGQYDERPHIRGRVRLRTWGAGPASIGAIRSPAPAAS